MATIAGCAKSDNIASEQELHIYMTIETAYANPEPSPQAAMSKSYLEYANGNLFDVIWHAGDRIAMVPVGSNGNVETLTEGKYFTTTEGGQTATFEGETLEAEKYIGMYPVDGLDFIQDEVKVIFKNIYENQIANKDNLGKDMLISVSKQTVKGETMYFYNACGLIRFTIPENLTNITKVAFRGGNGEKLAGRIKIDYGDEVKTTFQERYIGQKSSNTLTLSNADGSPLTPGTYYMVALPTKLENGFTVAMHAADGKRYIRSSNSNSNEIARSGILNLGVLNLSEATPAHSDLFLMSEGNGWSFEQMSGYPIDPFVFRHGTYLKNGQFKFGTTSGEWTNNYKALETDNANYLEYEDAMFVSDYNPDQKWYITDNSESGKPCKIVMDITTGVEKMYLTEFNDYEWVRIIGSATQYGWDLNADDAKFTSKGDFIHEWTGNLTAGEFKFSLKNGDAAEEFGRGEWLMATSDSQTFTTGENLNVLYIDIDKYLGYDYKWVVSEEDAGNYTISINTLTEKISIVKN